jgi:AAA ATPase domain/Adenylate and Guanylate cyclase catalytic domain
LFTDVVGSTDQRVRLGDAAVDQLLRGHDAVVAGVLAAHGGELVKSTGDGAMCAFAGASDALAAAVAIQQRLERRNRDAPEQVRVRVGVSLGDVAFEDGDLHGLAVHEAARVCAAAEAGEILVSDVVRTVAGSRADCELVARGELKLKGLPQAVKLWRVAWVAAPEPEFPFPPLLESRQALAFSGRTGELAMVLEAWKGASGGARHCVVVSGEPGIGKTRLVAEAARVAHGDGAMVLYGRCDDELGVPFQPFAEALDWYVARADQVVMGRWPGDLARLAPQLSDRVPSLPPPLEADPESEQYRLFDAVASWLTGLSADQPVVLVLDDLHWATKPTLLMLRHVVRTTGPARLLVVVTYRETDVAAEHPFAATLAFLHQEPGVERIALGGLDADALGLVLEAAGYELDTAGVELRDTLMAETDGNPFFVGQVLRHLVESGAVTEQDGRWVRSPTADRIGVPESVRAVIRRRLDRLDDKSNAVLTVAAVIGRDFDAELLTTATEMDAELVLDGLEAAEAGRLIEASPGRAQFRFVHALVRSTLYDGIPTTRRLRLHRGVARAFEQRAETNRALLPTLAHHYCEAASLGETDKAIRFATEAAEGAIARLAYEEAADLYERALAVIEPRSGDERAHRGDLLIELANARLAAGDRGAARQAAFEAAQHGREVGRPDLLADAATSMAEFRRPTETGRMVDEALVALCEETLDALPAGDSIPRAKVAARLASELHILGEAGERRRALTDDAVAMARRLGDPATLADVLVSAHWGIWAPGTARECLAIAEEVLQLGQRAGNRDLELSGAMWAFNDLMELGETARADDMLAIQAAIAAELNRPDKLWDACVYRCARLLMEGRYDEAAQVADEGLAHGQSAQIEPAMWAYGVEQFELARARGGLEAFEPLFLGMIEQYSSLPIPRCALAYLYAALERPDEARAQIDILAGDGFDILPTDATWLSSVGLLIVACASIGDRERAAHLYDMLMPYRDDFVTLGNGWLVAGSAERYLALAAAATDRWDAADEHFNRAMERNARSGNLAALVFGKYEYAALLSRRGNPEDRPRLQELLRDCSARATALGMTRVIDRVRTLAKRVGVEFEEGVGS